MAVLFKNGFGLDFQNIDDTESKLDSILGSVQRYLAHFYL